MHVLTNTSIKYIEYKYVNQIYRIQIRQSNTYMNVYVIHNVYICDVICVTCVIYVYNIIQYKYIYIYIYGHIMYALYDIYIYICMRNYVSI